MYQCSDEATNNIGKQGCLNLTKAKWDSLQYIDICINVVTKGTIRLAKGDTGS